MREVEELVFHRFAERGFDLHFLETRRIAIHTHGEGQGFVVHELVQAFHGSGRPAFGFHRHDPAVAFEHKIDLARAAVFPPPVKELPASSWFAHGHAKLLGHPLLAQSATQRGGQIRPARKGISRRGVPERMRQSNIQQHDFSQPLVDFPGEGHAMAFRVWNRIAELRHAQQIQRALGLLVFHLTAYEAVSEFGAQLIDDTAQHIVQDSRLHAARVFGKIVSISLDEIALEPAALVSPGTPRIRRHHLRHPPGHQKAVVKFHPQRVGGIAQWNPGRPLLQPLQELLPAMRHQKLHKRHRLHKSERNPAHRHAVFKIPQRKFQQRPCRNHWQLRHLLGKPAQLSQNLRRRLDFIQKQNQPLDGSLHAGSEGEIIQPPPGAAALLPKNPRILRIPVKIHLQKRPPLRSGQLPHQPSLPRLTRSPYDQWFSSLGDKPRRQKIRKNPLH